MTTNNESRHAMDRNPISLRIRRLLETTADLGGEDELRRDALVERAEELGLGRLAAEQAYDLATEESLKPAWGIAVMIEGVSVEPFSGAAPDVDASERAEPEWVDAPPLPGDAERERRLRLTFRRIRSRFEEAVDPESALDALSQDPDFEAYDYEPEES